MDRCEWLLDSCRHRRREAGCGADVDPDGLAKLPWWCRSRALETDRLGSRMAGRIATGRRRVHRRTANTAHSGRRRGLGVRVAIPSSVKVILFGATGMVGAGVLHECLRDDRVDEVWAVQRSSSGRSHPKLRELIRTDFLDFRDALEDFHGADACFFCLGVTAVGKGEEEYSRLTFDLTLAAGRAMAEVTPGMTFCYVSGQGTDSSEKGRVMWARVKGRTENALLQLPLREIGRAHV